jgi:hypothetical protein
MLGDADLLNRQARAGKATVALFISSIREFHQRTIASALMADTRLMTYAHETAVGAPYCSARFLSPSECPRPHCGQVPHLDPIPHFYLISHCYPLGCSGFFSTLHCLRAR